jgi:hypothetical protein
LKDYNCMPGHILAYYPEDQTADVQISAEEVLNSAADYMVLSKRAPIVRLPVHTSSGGGWSITMPIKAGDSCLVVFTDVGISHWFLEDKDDAGTINEDPHPNLLGGGTYEEGLVIVGFNTVPRAIGDYSEDGSQWRNAGATQSIHLKEDGTIEVESPTTINVTSPSVHIESPAVTMSGTLDVTGGIVGGTVATVAGIDLDTHVHAGSPTTPVGPLTPTGVPVP